MVASPEYSGDYALAVVRTNVYDVTNEKRMWTGTSQILVTGEIPSHIAQYVNTVLKNLYTNP